MTQDQAFKAYYSTMADADLLRLAANKRSYIEAAQRSMADELARRHLSLPVEACTTGGRRFRWSIPSAIKGLTRVFRH
jgi:hypothetical protein